MPTPPRADHDDPVATIYRLVDLDRPTLRRTDVEERTGVPRDLSLRWWRAMGFAQVGDDDVAFSEADVEIVTRLAQLMELGVVDDDDVLRLAQLMGASFTRLADAQLDAIEEALADQASDSSPAQRWRLLAETDTLGTDIFGFVEEAMTYVWKRHLAAALGRRLGVEDDTTEQAVGFADLSGFSRLSKEIAPEGLARVIATFEEIALDVVADHEGRVVKLIGDEVMYASPNLDDAVAISLELIRRLAAVEGMPSVHCGIAHGPTVTVAGDVFGPTVNLASRLTGIARPGSIALTQDDGAALAERDDIVLRRVRRPHLLKGVGRTNVVVVRPAAVVQSAS